MESAISDLTGVTEADDEQSAEVLESSLVTTSALTDDLPEIMEVSTSFARPEDKEAEDTLTLGAFDLSFPSCASSSQQSQINPIIEQLKLDYPDIGYGDFNPLEAELQGECPRLWKEIEDGSKEKIQKILEDDDIQGAKTQVIDMLNIFHAIRYLTTELIPNLIPNQRLRKAGSQKKKAASEKEKKKKNADPMETGSENDTEGKEITLLELYYRFFAHALRDKECRACKEYFSPPSPKSSIAPFTCSTKHYKRSEFVAFLIKKVRKEQDIMDGLDETKGCLVTKCIQKYEDESFAACILHVRQRKLKEAAKLLEETVKSMKPSDKLDNCGRVYNSILQEAAGDHVQVPQVLEVQLIKAKYQPVGDYFIPIDPDDNDDLLEQSLQGFTKVQEFFVDLILKDTLFMQNLTFGWMRKHDFHYLLLCVWECYKRQNEVPYLAMDYHCNLDISKLCTGIDSGSKGGMDNHSKDGMDSDSEYVRSEASVKDVRFEASVEDARPEALVEYAFLAAVVIEGNRLDIINEFFLKRWPDLDINAQYNGVTALHVAVHKGREEMLKFLLANTKLDINVRTARRKDNMWGLPQHRTSLHMATENGYAKFVEILCRDDTLNPHKKSIRCHEEDAENMTALDIVYEKLKPKEWKEKCYQHGAQSCGDCRRSYEDIEKILLSLEAVQKGIDRLYRNRQVLLDAINTILVGAALIASVTFAGWLQPPLGYAQYYDFPTPSPAPPGTYDSFLGIEGNVGIQAFALFNSLSFFFAIATVIVGADAAFPMDRYKYIGHIVKPMQLLLRRAITSLMISLVCVLGAFGSAAVVILPPHAFFRKNLVLTILIGGGVCCIVLWQLLTRHSERIQNFNKLVLKTISQYTYVFAVDHSSVFWLLWNRFRHMMY